MVKIWLKSLPPLRMRLRGSLVKRPRRQPGPRSFTMECHAQEIADRRHTFTLVNGLLCANVAGTGFADPAEFTASCRSSAHNALQSVRRAFRSAGQSSPVGERRERFFASNWEAFGERDATARFRRHCRTKHYGGQHRVVCPAQREREIALLRSRVVSSGDLSRGGFLYRIEDGESTESLSAGMATGLPRLRPQLWRFHGELGRGPGREVRCGINPPRRSALLPFAQQELFCAQLERSQVCGGGPQ